jgi:hypothetical protein
VTAGTAYIVVVVTYILNISLALSVLLNCVPLRSSMKETSMQKCLSLNVIVLNFVAFRSLPIGPGIKRYSTLVGCTKS